MCEPEIMIVEDRKFEIASIDQSQLPQPPCLPYAYAPHTFIHMGQVRLEMAVVEAS